MTDVLFADISEFQSNANISTYATWSDTLIARAHNGYRADYSFPARLGVMRSAKLRTRIYYQYIVAGADPVWQARAFISVIGQLQPGEIVLADYEEGAANAISRLKAWFGVVDPWSGLRYGAALYTGESFLNSYLGGAGAWTGRPLILAKYGQPEPSEPHIGWQFTDGINNGPINVPGIGRCDVSVHHGDSLSLAEGLGATNAPAGQNPNPSTPTVQVVAAWPTPTGAGYYLVGNDGGVKTFGDAVSRGDLHTVQVNDTHVVGGWPTPTGNGYILIDQTGGVFAFGDAQFHGSLGGVAINKPIVGGCATKGHDGYWLFGADGGVYCFGAAGFDGSMGGQNLAASVVGGASTGDANGYWLVAADGGVFCFGDAPFDGSTGGIKLNAPVVGLTPTPSGRGYWMVSADGGVFSFGDAGFHGSAGSLHLNRPAVCLMSTPSGNGYWIVGADGGVYSYGDAGFYGSQYP